MARAIAKEIQIAVTPQEEERLRRARPVNPEAYEAYLKGRLHAYRMSPEGLETALGYFNLSLQKDPDYALAYTGMSDVWGARGVVGFVRPQEAFSIGKPAALKAVALDDLLAEGHELLARWKLMYEWDWAEAERESQRARALNPNTAEVHFAHCLSLLWITNHAAEALAQIERALEWDPFNSWFQTIMGVQLLYARRYDEAVRQFRKALEAEANNPWPRRGLWSAFHQMGMPEEALAEAKRFWELFGDTEASAVMQRGYPQSGYQAVLRFGAEKLAEQAKLRYLPATQIARLYAHADEKDAALEWLQKAYEQRDPWMVELRVDSDWNSLRSDRRFQALLARMNFPN